MNLPIATRDIRSVVASAASLLPPARFSTSRLDCELLVMEALGCDRVELYRHPERVFTAEESHRFDELLARRQGGEPMSYILGHREFYGRDFRLTPDVLIPRPETELIIDLALKLFPPPHRAPRRALDIGSGSGCLAVTLAAEFPGLQVTAWDICEKALAVARDNALRLNVAPRCDFLQRDALAPETWANATGDSPYELIVSNPPYVTDKEFTQLSPSVRDFEPRKALLAPQNGLVFYLTFARQTQALLDKDGWLLLEIGAAQGSDVLAMLQSAGWRNIQVHKDLADHDRVVSAQRP
jgi:release factor glutamine methyltransferase